MFSTTPNTRMLVLVQKLSSFRTSAVATAWGVVTTTAPATWPGSASFWSVSARDICSSLVPGGVSMSRKSVSSQSTSLRNCRIIAVFFGPLQTTASPRFGRRKPRLIACRDPRPLDESPSCTNTGAHPPGTWVTFDSSIESMRGIEGPVKSTSRIPTE
ncbi:hypothetical protein FOIG_04735 [Fusarium odoratissimum NRRL 54006]|uniref:Uncharacterized protein n=1 Tax=Fusarium odoratissimum (strain NRRL 54006) TaxID=1089451 RepID=X0K6Z1_FUSO5|nr:uncharacterized protein FOIG_04735 [Fusarium odoratissimum NRRL 54006]XP_031066611.1 uncharacterized protein FOIG_04735 [Fusarium odoratissimum NRRL 54006]EXM04521.1 hypothetical protein FOIG_04735 [Fusarium odoratissimum NRRL 54006]EXM04522.1 hypothetical protein FOIG_04735 [Fusarium odoratissimum NRRL 54006]